MYENQVFSVFFFGLALLVYNIPDRRLERGLYIMFDSCNGFMKAEWRGVYSDIETEKLYTCVRL